MALSVLLADDHQIVRQGLRALLAREPDFRLAGEAADGHEALRLAAELRPDVLVLDLMLPGVGGLEVTRQLGRFEKPPRVVVLSMHSNEAYVLEAVRAGAAAYVLKEAGADELVRAIREVAAGRRYFSPPLTEADIEAYARKIGPAAADPYQLLTAREKEVLRMTADGQSCTEIAEKLFISARTVENHRANLMRKIGVRNQKELVRYAVERRALFGEP
jgi:two-component system, NarL family, response regulator NreC